MDTSDLTNVDTEQIAIAIRNMDSKMLGEAAILLVVGAVLIWLVMRIIRRASEKLPTDRALSSFLTSGIRIGLILILGTMVADRLGFPVSTLVAVVSLLGLAISLSVQNVLGNLSGGFVILSSRLFVAGDWIEVGTVAGTVESIKLMYTTLSTADHKKVLIPNSDLASSRIINYSAYHLRRVDLTIRVPYQYDNQSVMESLLKAAGSIERVEKDEPHAPAAAVSSYEESGVVFALRVWTKQQMWFSVKEELTDRMRSQLHADGIELREYQYFPALKN